MSVFDSLSIAGSGLVTHRKWLDAVSDNIANVNDATSTDKPAFQERMVEAQAVDYGSGEGGVAVSGVKFGSAAGRTVYEPGNPLADIRAIRQVRLVVQAGRCYSPAHLQAALGITPWAQPPPVRLANSPVLPGD